MDDEHDRADVNLPTCSYILFGYKPEVILRHRFLSIALPTRVHMSSDVGFFSFILQD